MGSTDEEVSARNQENTPAPVCTLIAVEVDLSGTQMQLAAPIAACCYAAKQPGTVLGCLEIV